jgi:ribosomal protein L40E
MARKSLGYVQLEWTCPRCGGKNPGPQKTCLSCGGPQPDDVQFQQSQGQEMVTGEAAEEIAKKSADIHCGFCGTRNPSDAVVCSQCGGNLEEGAKRAAGQVLGAFKDEPVPEINCPNCNQPNPASALNCANCGASLAITPPAPVQVPAQKPAKRGPLAILFAIFGIGLLVGLCLLVISLLSGGDDLTGTVQSVNWSVSVPIEAYQPVTRSDWKKNIPGGVDLGSCEYRYSYTSDEPEVVATEVCGTPYTVDQGTGFGEVVQDCSYRVYEEVCSYTVTDWVVISTSRLEGSDLQPRLPQLMEGQRFGDGTETYAIVFSTEDGSKTFTTSDLGLFQQAQIGSRWKLTTNALGGIRSIEPAR